MCLPSFSDASNSISPSDWDVSSEQSYIVSGGVCVCVCVWCVMMMLTQCDLLLLLCVCVCPVFITSQPAHFGLGCLKREQSFSSKWWCLCVCFVWI